MDKGATLEAGEGRNTVELVKSASEKHLDLLRPSARYYSVSKVCTKKQAKNKSIFEAVNVAPIALEYSAISFTNYHDLKYNVPSLLRILAYALLFQHCGSSVMELGMVQHMPSIVEDMPHN
ncbi:hypothetical protein MTR67_031700 [Solanum verrucosum]|uniref:Uncharacterized protein n=1 Tax=Solanum verrucosum TaxID=315347 RepID=A0AAF0ZGL0_SOLVR|nr:hypothetical protein MTR67_031700 [Solanum verrucosum]